MARRTCEICGEQVSRYVCSQCGKVACRGCFYPQAWICVTCRRQAIEAMPEGFVWPKPFALFFLGFLVIFIGMIFIMIATIMRGAISPTVGGVFLIGPIPITLGAGPHSFLAILLAAILLIAILVLVYLILPRRL